MIKLKILRWTGYPGSSKWAQCNHKSSYKREARWSKSETGEVTTETEVGEMHPEGERATSQGTQTASKLEKTRKQILP